MQGRDCPFSPPTGGLPRAQTHPPEGFLGESIVTRSPMRAAGPQRQGPTSPQSQRTPWSETTSSPVEAFSLNWPEAALMGQDHALPPCLFFHVPIAGVWVRTFGPGQQCPQTCLSLKQWPQGRRERWLVAARATTLWSLPRPRGSDAGDAAKARSPEAHSVSLWDVFSLSFHSSRRSPLPFLFA